MSSDRSTLPVEEILRLSAEELAGGRVIGRSRQGRPIRGYRLGRGPCGVSLLAGCHADEPVGPAMLLRLLGYLSGRPKDGPLLERFTWTVIPHLNPDGEAANRAWIERRAPVSDHRGDSDEGFLLAPYLRRVVRERPGDDVEFGFPRDDRDTEARPENVAAAGFLAEAAPYRLHASFHGMGLASGPWFLIEGSWADRTRRMRERLRRRVAAMGYRLFDPDRKGEKGFTRIDAGFTTRPDSRAMADHFSQRGDNETAGRFRPSSMELVRRLGGDPLTIVSEMPLFLLPAPGASATEVPDATGTAGRERLHLWLERLLEGRDGPQAQAEAAAHGVVPMPIGDQMRLQLAYLVEALATACGGSIEG